PRRVSISARNAVNWSSNSSRASLLEPAWEACSSGTIAACAAWLVTGMEPADEAKAVVLSTTAITAPAKVAWVLFMPLTCRLNFYATVLTVSSFSLTNYSRTLFTVADSLDLVAGSTVNDQEVTDAVRTTLTQSQVVFTGTALVSVSFQTNATVRVGSQVTSVNDQSFTVGRLEFCYVKIEVEHSCVQS